MGYFAIDNRSPDLKHYGVLGMKWGVRRYENEDGTLTEAGKKRYGHMYKSRKTSSATNKVMSDWRTMTSDSFKAKYHVSKDTYSKRAKKYNDPSKEAPLARLGRKMSSKTVYNYSKVYKYPNKSNDKFTKEKPYTIQSKDIPDYVRRVNKQEKKFSNNPEAYERYMNSNDPDVIKTKQWSENTRKKIMKARSMQRGPLYFNIDGQTGIIH